ncbi:MAG: DUF3048 domain-containing protein [Defluviitaleaceae bacterium]|nr:DUF3048 domain-containing protein [Defluviitaleaceae bacterium]
MTKEKFEAFWKKALEVIKMRVFLIAFGSSLGVVLIVFLIFAITSSGGGEERLPAKVFEELPAFTPPEDLGHFDEGYEDEEENEEDEIPPYHTFSLLTGLLIHEDYAARRPLAVVVNNIRSSHPQSGIASADIVYEVLSEGDVTRLIAIFQSYFPEKIGSIRSARDYFIDFAFNHDAVFVFHGASPSGHGRIRSTGVTNLDGGQLEGSVFWRDRSFPAWTGNKGQRSREHSSFTGREQIEAHMDAREMRTTIGENPAYGFYFGELAEEMESLGEAKRVVVPFSRNYTRTFIFCEEYGHYLVENNAGAHRDAETEEQVAVKNILIRHTRMNVIAGDVEGRRNVNTVGTGTGYLITGGEHYAVLWEKASHTAPTIWTFEDGTPLTLTPGRTWVCVFQHTGTVQFE